ncbi:MAG: JmjC domain-containing protein [Bacteriovoracaceae bacterium]
MNSALLALIHPLTMTDFFTQYEKNEPLLIESNFKLHNDLLQLPFLWSLESMMLAWPNSVQVHLPDVRDEASSIETNTHRAKELFDDGMGLLFNEVQTISPMLTDWVQALRQDLGVSQLTIGRALVYATPDGKGTAPHFDQNMNFVIQLHGTKIWTMAPNYHVKNPLTRHTMGLPMDPELASYVDDEMPLEMPQNAQSYVLKTGSVLFVPRGYWHSTMAQGDALALNFTFTAPTWLDLFSAALRSRLAQSPEWRETADGVADFDRVVISERRFDYLLKSLVNDLPNWKASDILGATEAEM